MEDNENEFENENENENENEFEKMNLVFMQIFDSFKRENLKDSQRDTAKPS